MPERMTRNWRRIPPARTMNETMLRTGPVDDVLEWVQERARTDQRDVLVVAIAAVVSLRYTVC